MQKWAIILLSFLTYWGCNPPQDSAKGPSRSTKSCKVKESSCDTPKQRFNKSKCKCEANPDYNPQSSNLNERTQQPPETPEFIEVANQQECQEKGKVFKDGRCYGKSIFKADESKCWRGGDEFVTGQGCIERSTAQKKNICNSYDARYSGIENFGSEWTENETCECSYGIPFNYKDEKCGFRVEEIGAACKLGKGTLDSAGSCGCGENFTWEASINACVCESGRWSSETNECLTDNEYTCRTDPQSPACSTSTAAIQSSQQSTTTQTPPQEEQNNGGGSSALDIVNDIIQIGIQGCNLFCPKKSE